MLSEFISDDFQLYSIFKYSYIFKICVIFKFWFIFKINAAIELRLQKQNIISDVEDASVYFKTAKYERKMVQ